MDSQPSDAEMTAKFAQVRRLAEEAEAEVVSEDGTVRVVAGPSGTIKHIDLRMHAFELSGAELGDAITDTLKAAGRKVDHALSEEIGRLLGRSVPPDLIGSPTGTREEQGR